MRHVIKKQVIDIRLDKSLDAFRIQQLASGQFNRDILSILEQQFSEFSGEEEVIIIDKLEIDLHTIFVKEMEQTVWDHELCARIQQLIKEQLQSFALQKNVIRQTRSLGICRQWLFYIQNGYLPWTIQEIDKNSMIHVLETLAVDYELITELRSVILQNKNAAARIIMQYDPVFLSKLVEVMTAEKQTELPAAIEEAYILFQWFGQQEKKPVQGLPDKKTFQWKLWKEILNIAATGKKDLSTAKLIVDILQSLYKPVLMGEKIPDTVLLRLKLIADVVRQPEKDKPDAEAKSDQQQKIGDADGETFFENEEDSAIRQQTNETGTSDPEKDLVLSGTDREKNITAREPGEKDDNVSELKGSEKIDEDGIFVVNAGVVLLHPFLNSFFQRLQLIKDASFIDISAHKKALHLLHYLATGRADAEEYELTIPKILCAWPLDMPVEKEASIIGTEYNEAINLLVAVIEQWDILKNTSIDGLREGFLQRNAKVFTKNDNLYIHVESSSIDVLLDYLPWNLSMIKLPWMKEMLRVEWR